MISNKKIKIKQNEYSIAFPNAGQFFDIELLKVQLTEGRYGQLFAASTIDSSFALDMVDMEANFTVLIPDLKKDLNVKTFRDLSIEDMAELTKIYRDQVIPFISEVRKVINDSFIKKEDKEDE